MRFQTCVYNSINHLYYSYVIENLKLYLYVVQWYLCVDDNYQVSVQGLLFKQYNNNNNNISRNAYTFHMRGHYYKIYNTYNKYDYVYREQCNNNYKTIYKKKLTGIICHVSYQ